MVAYHPSEIELTEFSSGTLPWALSIALSAHIHFCPQCKEKVKQLNTLGGQILEQKIAEPLKDGAKPDMTMLPDSFSKTMAKIKNMEASGGAAVKQTLPTNFGNNTDKKFDRFPKVVKKIIGDPKSLSWSFMSPSLRAARLRTGQDEFEVSLHRIKKGGAVAEHDHGGLEVVVVLDGSFSDELGTYHPGDYLVKDKGDCHRPTATMDKDCICLSIVAAPVQLTGFLGKVVNPFLKIRPA